MRLLGGGRARILPRDAVPVAGARTMAGRMMEGAATPAPQAATTPPTARAVDISRRRALAALAHVPFDVLVVGGGATGAGIARDAVTRGLSVALVEASDFAGETSSHSSKLIHGGLRYLQYLDLGLVFEALRERRILMGVAPHLCQPIEFVFPVYRGLPPRLATLGAGIALYNGLGLWRPPAGGHRLSVAEAQARVPGIRPDGLAGAQTYLDCQTDDARLVLEAVLDAETAGATTVSRLEILRLVRDRRGRVRGAVGRDALTESSIEIQARVVVNATGPFSDAFDRGRSNLRPTLGVHIVLDSRRLPHHGRAVVLRSPRDGRLVFLLPGHHRTLVGTTDTDWTPPAPARGDQDEGGDRSGGGRPRVGAPIVAGASDVAYLLEVVNHAFPEAKLAPEDVISTLAGLRPLVAARDHTASSTSREHEILSEPDGLITVVGGKLTTFRHMAAQATDLVIDKLRVLGFEGHLSPCSTATRPFYGTAHPGPEGEPLSLGDVELAPDVEAHLRRTYGRHAAAVVAVAAGGGVAAPAANSPSQPPLALAARIYPDLPYIWAEIVHAARHELATTLEDILRRRVPVFRDASDQGLAAAETAATLGGAALGWSAAERDRMIADYRRSISAASAWRRDGSATRRLT